MNMGHLHVVVMDNLETGNLANLEPWLGEENSVFVQGQHPYYEDCVKACEGINVVLHQAAHGGVPRSIENPGNAYHKHDGYEHTKETRPVLWTWNGLFTPLLPRFMAMTWAFLKKREITARAVRLTR